jgi:hypothetical protein
MLLAAGSLAATAAAADYTGMIVDKECSVRGKAMWYHQDCIACCIRDGQAPVLAVDEDKIYAIANQAKVPEEAYGAKVKITGDLKDGTLTIEKIELLRPVVLKRRQLSTRKPLE